MNTFYLSQSPEGIVQFVLSFSYDEDLILDVKLIEGRKWNKKLRVWTTPASLPAWQDLAGLGFEPKGPRTAEYCKMLSNLAKGVRPTKHDFPEQVGSFTLLPFQQEGVGFLRTLDFALLHDDMGIGKTLQGATWAFDQKYVVVIAPRVVLGQWKAMAEELGVEQIVVQPDAFPIGGTATWVITNYERADRLLNSAVPPSGFTMIVDECHFIKNSKSKRTQAVLGLGKLAKRVLALSGTPVVNRPVELFNLLVLLRQRDAKQFWGHAQTYCGAYRTPYGWDLSGATNLSRLHNELLHFSLRRTKEEVLPDLPRKWVTPIELSEMPSRKLVSMEEQVMGRSFIEINANAPNVLRYRQQVAIEKVPSVAEWIEVYRTGGGGSLLVFCSFKEPLYQLAERLAESEIRCAFYTGDENESQREAAKQAAAEGAVLLLTYGAGGFGLDGLQYHTDTACFVDLPWTPTELSQAEDRLYRTGQTKGVQCVQFIMSASPVERLVMQAQRDKRDVIEVLNGRGVDKPGRVG